MKIKESTLRKIVTEEIQSVVTEFDIDGSNYVDKNMRQDTTKRYLFTVANDADGIDRIKRMKDAMKPYFTFQLRGRHHDRKEVLGDKWKPGVQNDVPLRDAEYIAVYVDPK